MMRSRTLTVLALAAALFITIVPVAGAQTSGDDAEIAMGRVYLPCPRLGDGGRLDGAHG